MAKGKTIKSHPELGLPEVRKLWQTEGLFSEHYLKARIQRNGWWPTDDAVRPLWQFCVELFNRRYVPCAQNNEAFTRQELLNPILAKLGFSWTDNLSLPDQDAEPDYILFASAAEKEAVIALNRETLPCLGRAAGSQESQSPALSDQQTPATLPPTANSRLSQRSPNPRLGYPHQRQRVAALLP
jgi:hypothetical protein